MSSDHQASIQQSSATWPEPPWSGWIETTGDALLILEAAKRGIIPRVTRRLVDTERKMITSGSVFVFDEDESGIKRWTDGFYWSPSRILGNFLLYRETDKRGQGHRGARPGDSDPDDNPRQEGQSLSRPKADHAGVSLDKQSERSLLGSLTNSYKFKPDGLMKKTFSVTIGEGPQTTQHLISYYRIEDVKSGRLRSPSSLPELASLDISPEYLDKTHFRNPPKVEIGVDGIPRYRGEADDNETSPMLSAPLSTALPLLSASRIAEAGNKRGGGKRYDPYATSPTTFKRARRNTKSSQPDSPATVIAEPVSPVGTAGSTTPQPGPPPPAAAGLPAPMYQDQNPPVEIPTQPQPPAPPPGTYPPPYGVPAFYPGYPPPPPGHMYAAPPPHGPPHQVGVAYGALPPPPPSAGSATSPHAASPPGSAAGVGASAGGGITPGGSGQYPYPGFPPPPAIPPAVPHSSSPQQAHGSHPSQAGLAAPPQPYYPYYAPPPVAGYAPWPVYSGYPPHQPIVPPLHVHAAAAQAAPLQHPVQPKQEGLGGGGEGSGGGT